MMSPWTRAEWDLTFQSHFQTLRWIDISVPRTRQRTSRPVIRGPWSRAGVDLLNMQATKPDTVAKGPDGSAARGAAKGAVAGVAIGAIAGDTGIGVAIGAAAGGMKGVSGSKKKQVKAQEDAKKQAAAADQAKIDSFKKAYSACLEGKGYTVK